MKNLILTLFLVVSSAVLFAQPPPSLSITDALSGNVLPNGSYHTYQVSMLNFNNSACNYGSSCRFKWEVKNGTIAGSAGTVYEGNGLTSINVIWENKNANAEVKVTSSNSTSCSSCPDLTATRVMPIKYLGAVGNIKINGTARSGAYELPCGTSSITVSVDGVTNATTYDWNEAFPAGWTKTGSGNSITVTPTAGTGGTIGVRVSRSDVPGLYTIVHLNITRPTPVLNSITPGSGETVLCSSSNTSLASAAGTNADAFLWTPYNGVTINSSTSPVITTGSVTVGGTSTGHYKVQAYSYSCGNVASTSSANHPVRVGPVVFTGFTSIYNGSGSGQYFCSSHFGDGFEIGYSNGSASTQFDVRFLSYPALSVIHTQTTYSTFSSTYTFPGGFSGYIVAEVNDHVCPDFWSGTEIEVVNCTGSYFLSSVYPNPTVEELTVEFRNASTKSTLPEALVIYSENSSKPLITISVKDVYNKRGLVDNNKLKIDVKGLSAGKYFIHVKPDGKSDQRVEKIPIIVNR